MKNQKPEHDQFVGIAAAVGITSLIMVLFVVLFAEMQSYVIPWIVGFMALMGIFLGYFASNKR